MLSDFNLPYCIKQIIPFPFHFHMNGRLHKFGVEYSYIDFIDIFLKILRNWNGLSYGMTARKPISNVR